MRKLLALALLLSPPLAFALTPSLSLVCTPNPATYGNYTASCVATVSGSSPAPTGYPSIFGVPGTIVTGTSSGSSSAVYFWPTTAGSYTVTATYDGDSNYSSATTSITLVINGSPAGSGPAQKILTGSYRKIFISSGWTYSDTGGTATLNPAGAYTSGQEAIVESSASGNGSCTWYGPHTTAGSTMTLSVTATFAAAASPTSYQTLAYKIGSGSVTYWYASTSGSSATTYTATIPSGTDLSTVHVSASSSVATHYGNIVVADLSIY